MLIKSNEPQGDSLEYDLIEQAIQFLKDPIGNTVEIGVRDGFASKLIIDAWRRHQKKTTNTFRNRSLWGYSI
jgi:hypothetical protein